MIFVYILLGIVTLIAVLTLIATKKFEVNRPININCSKEILEK